MSMHMRKNVLFLRKASGDAVAAVGGEVEIRPNNHKYTVNVYAKCTETEINKRTGITYYLSRPMTEAERLEADLYTGRGKDWEYAE